MQSLPLGFDPFTETRKALAELMQSESDQRKSAAGIHPSLSSETGINKPQPSSNLQNNHNMHFQQHLLETSQHRARMPPPGFNHVYDFGMSGTPRMAPNNRKLSPFMNMSNSTINNSQSLIPMMHGSPWNSNHLGTQQPSNEMQLPQVGSLGGYHHRGNNNSLIIVDRPYLYSKINSVN